MEPSTSSTRRAVIAAAVVMALWAGFAYDVSRPADARPCRFKRELLPDPPLETWLREHLIGASRSRAPSGPAASPAGRYTTPTAGCSATSPT